jgi:hypothetical protein
MKQVQVLSLFVFTLIGNVLSGSNHVFQDLKDREGVLSFLEYYAAVSPSSSVTDKPLMVGLTLIQGADSSGAGTSFLSLILVSIVGIGCSCYQILL